MSYHDAIEARVIPSWGTCRELLADLNEEIRVVVSADGDDRLVSALDLFQLKRGNCMDECTDSAED